MCFRTRSEPKKLIPDKLGDGTGSFVLASAADPDCRDPGSADEPVPLGSVSAAVDLQLSRFRLRLNVSVAEELLPASDSEHGGSDGPHVWNDEANITNGFQGLQQTFKDFD